MQRPSFLTPLYNRTVTSKTRATGTTMEGYVQLSEPAEVVERLPVASHVTFEPPPTGLPSYPMAVSNVPNASGTRYPDVGLQLPTMSTAMSAGVPMDLNNDGRPDAIGYDTTGDGRVDCIKLLPTAMTPAVVAPLGQVAAGLRLVETVVPPNVRAGMQIVVQAPDGAMCRATVPPNAPPGSRLRVHMPAHSAQTA